MLDIWSFKRPRNKLKKLLNIGRRTGRIPESKTKTSTKNSKFLRFSHPATIYTKFTPKNHIFNYM